MPKYIFQIDNQKYSVESDKEPTKEQLLSLVEKQKAATTLDEEESIIEPKTKFQEQNTTLQVEEPEKLTEESIKKDPKWIEASKTIYEWDWKRKNPDKDIPKISDEGYANFGLEYGSGLSFSDVDLIREGQAIGNATDEQKQAFINIMDMYDEKSASWAGAGRALKNILNPLESPTTYVGIGAGKLASTAAKKFTKDAIKNNLIKSIVASKPGRYALIGSAEGTAYGGAYETARQRAKIRAEGQEKYKPGDIAESAGVGTIFGGVLGGTAGVIANAVTRRAKKTDPDLALPAPQKEIEALAEAVPEVKPIVRPEQPTPPTRTVEGELVTSPISREIREIVEPFRPVDIVVDKDVGILGRVPYVGSSYKKLANNVLNKLETKAQKVSPLGELEEQPKYLGLRGQMFGKEERISNLTKNIFKTFNELSMDQNKPIYKYLLGEKPISEVPENLKDSAWDLRKGIDTVSEILEERDMLSTEVMAENYGTYLPRAFLKYYNKYSKPFGYLKKRKDLDDATREFLGEIEDVGYLGAKAIQEPISDAIRLDFFRELSQNPKWALQETMVPFRGRNIGVFHAKKEANRITEEIVEGARDKESGMAILKDLKDSIKQAEPNIAKVDERKWKQLPNQKKYGELSGAYIRKEVYDDLISAPHYANEIGNTLERIGREATKVWKTFKVPLNPPSVVRNFTSNLVLLNLSGVSLSRMPKRMLQAFQEILNKGKYYKIAQDRGVASTTFSKQEMVQINTMYKEIKAQKTKNWLDQAELIGSKLLNFAGDSYGFIETYGKIIKIIDDMEAGKNADTAVYNAQKTLFDYSLVPKPLEKWRQRPIGLPFATFQYKVAPFLIENFIRYPERFVKYMAVPYVAGEVWKKQNQGMTEEDLDSLKRVLPQWLRNGGNALVFPYKDDEGRWQFYDFSYTMPYGFYSGLANRVSTGEYGEAGKDVVNLIGGPGLSAITAIATGMDPFTRRPITTPGASWEDQASDILTYTWRTAAPTWLTDIGFAGKMYEAITKEPNYYGDPTITKPQAWWRLVGQNIYPVDPEQSRDTNLYFKNKAIQDAQKYYRNRIRQAELRGDQEEVTKLEKEAEQRINLLADELVEYEAQSKIPERLKRIPER